VAGSRHQQGSQSQSSVARIVQIARPDQASGTIDPEVRKDAESVRKPAETERNEATLADTPRACLFREAKPALLALGISDSRTGGLIVQWLS
jgi:hypothetical protein